MFSGGDQVTIKKTAQDVLCGGLVPGLEPPNPPFTPAYRQTCQDGVSAKVDWAYGEITDPTQRDTLDAWLKVWFNYPKDGCVFQTVVPTGLTTATGTDAIQCVDTFVRGASPRTITFSNMNAGGTSPALLAMGTTGQDNDFVTWVVKQIKAGRLTSVAAPLAAAESAFGSLNPDQKKAAMRLFHEAMQMVPPDQRAAAAKPVAEQIATQVGVSPDPRKAYVKDVVIDRTTPASPKYVVSVSQAPEALYDPEKLGFAKGETVPPEAIDELTRLFFEALMSYKAQTKTPNDKVPDAVVAADAAQTAVAVKEKVVAAKAADPKFAIAGLADLIKPYSARAQVNNKVLEKVLLDDGMVGGVDYRLIDGVTNARYSDYLQRAIVEFWSDEAAAKYAELKDSAAKKKFVDALIAQFNGYKADRNFAGQEEDVARAHQIALTRVVSVAPDGTPKLEAAPSMLSIRVADIGFAAPANRLAVYRKLKQLYKAAIAKDPAKYEGDGKATARIILATQIGARAKQFFDHENFAELPIDTRAFSGTLKPRSSIPAVSDFMRCLFNGFDGDGNVRPFFVAGLSSAVEAPVGGDGPLKISLGAEAFTGVVVAGEGSHKDSGLGLGVLTLDVNHTATPWFRWGARAQFLGGVAPEMIGAADSADPHQWEQGNAMTAAKMYEMWGLLAFMPVPQLELAFKGGIIPKRSASNGYGLEDIVLWYGKDDTVGGSRGPGLRLDPKLTLLDERLKIFGSFGYATYAGGIDFRGVPSDPADPTSEKTYAYNRGGHVLFGSLGLDGTIIKDWWRAGARYSGSAVVGGADEADMTSGYGQTAHILDLGTGILWGGTNHALDFNARLAWLGDERRQDTFKWMVGARYRGPDYAMAHWASFTPIVNVNYMDSSTTIRSGQDLYGGGTSCTGLSCAGGAGNLPTPGGPIFDIPLLARGLEISLQPKFKFRSGPEWLSGIYVQPVASLYWAQQGSASGAGSMAPGFFLGANFGIETDFNPFKK